MRASPGAEDSPTTRAGSTRWAGVPAPETGNARQPDGDDEDEDLGDDEVRDRLAERGDGSDRVVDPCPASQRGQCPERERQGRRDGEPQPSQEQGRRHAFEDDPEGRLAEPG